MASLRRSVAVSVLFTLFGGPVPVLFLGPLALTGLRTVPGRPEPVVNVAYVLIALGLAILLGCISRFIFVGRGSLAPFLPPEHLVVSGLYRFVRNPMYLGVVLALLGECLLFSPLTMAIYTVFVALGMHIWVCLYEEPHLAQLHPGDYATYMHHVPRWFPRPLPWSGPSPSDPNYFGPEHR